jgi:hypothetical protein
LEIYVYWGSKCTEDIDGIHKYGLAHTIVMKLLKVVNASAMAIIFVGTVLYGSPICYRLVQMKYICDRDHLMKQESLP